MTGLTLKGETNNQLIEDMEACLKVMADSETMEGLAHVKVWLRCLLIWRMAELVEEMRARASYSH